MKLTKMQRNTLKNRFGGCCAYCGDVLGDRFHADHTEAIYRDSFYDEGMWKPENDVLDKLFPACAPCNLFKSVFSIEQFRHEIQMQTERARKTSVNFRTAERFGLVTIKNRPVVFYFEQFNQSTRAV